jgi:hypothetical protein
MINRLTDRSIRIGMVSEKGGTLLLDEQLTFTLIRADC